MINLLFIQKMKIQIYIYMILLFVNNKLNKKIINKPIIHINRNYFDNRISNLDYDKINKINKKIFKKKIIDKSSYGINTDDLRHFYGYNK